MEKHTATSLAIKGLAGAVALAGGTQAYGAVVSATLPSNITGTGTTGEVLSTWDVNGDGADDFIFGAGAANIGGSKYLAYTGVTAYSGGVVGYTITGPNASYYYGTNLTKGTAIGGASTFVQGSYLTNLSIKYGTTTVGQFGTNSYLGFSFTATDGTHYGYIELTSTVASTAKPGTSKGSLTFTKAAYDNVAGEAIAVGALPTAVPEPGSLAALAFGAAGVAGAAAYRRQRATQTVA